MYILIFHGIYELKPSEIWYDNSKHLYLVRYPWILYHTLDYFVEIVSESITGAALPCPNFNLTDTFTLLTSTVKPRYRAHKCKN